jgi:hypothetical protein
MIKNKTIYYVVFIIVLVACFSYNVHAQDDISENIVLNSYPVPEIKYKEQSLYADFFDNNIFERFEKYLMFSTKTKELFGITEEAKRINAFDEVPDSPLFTNRNGKRMLSVAELQKGADLDLGPDMTQKWVITKGKSAGRNPGFFIKDSRGDKYLIKLDRKNYPEMITSCELIGSKFFHAIGYNVPQNTLCYFDSSILTVDPSARFYDADGREKSFTLEHALSILEEYAARNASGKYRAVASKIIAGVPKGYVSFRSSRDACQNDQIQHQNRREMRAYRVFSSWLNHHDARRGNTLDMLIEKENGWFLKQYLIDFGSCLGSHNMYGKYAEAGHTYVIDFWEIVKSWASLGLYKKPYYRRVMPFSPAVGYITSDVFNPGKWKPMIPNYAFDNMTNRDAFWAAKIVMSFTDEQVKALVEAGQLSIPRDRDYLIKVIKERRDAVGQYWFEQINPLDAFALSKEADEYVLTFKNLYRVYGFNDFSDALSYDYTVFKKNGTSKKMSAVCSGSTATELIRIPASSFENDSLQIVIKTTGGFKSWKKSVTVSVDSTKTICGIDREE